MHQIKMASLNDLVSANQYDTMLAFGPGVYGWLTGNSQDAIQMFNVG